MTGCDIICCYIICYALLCYALLCYAMPCYAMICEAMLFDATICDAMRDILVHMRGQWSPSWYVVNLLCYIVRSYALMCYTFHIHACTCAVSDRHRDMLCCAVLCYTMLCYAMLCYAMLWYAMTCCTFPIYSWKHMRSLIAISYFSCDYWSPCCNKGVQSQL